MNIIRYVSDFDGNEWFIIFSILAGTFLLIKLPRRFSIQTTIVYLLCGVFFGFLFDHTLSVLPVSYYTINDHSTFELMDFLSHIMYAPYSYLFFYLYDFFNIKLKFTLLYILVWAFLSIGFEIICDIIGIFHYENGYSIYYSFVIYLLVKSIWVIFYRIIRVYGDKQY